MTALNMQLPSPVMDNFLKDTGRCCTVLPVLLLLLLSDVGER
jgi:hypothetical protein